MTLELRRPGFREIINYRRSEFANQELSQRYPVRRGMHEEKTVHVSRFSTKEKGYVDLLPKIDEQSIDQVIESEIAARGIVNILDIGCGKGNFLLDCKRRWGEQVQAFGISAFKYHDEDETGAVGVKIGLGDAQSLLRTLKKNKMPISGYDLVVSVFALAYMPDRMSVIKQAYRVLSVGGVGMFDDPPIEARWWLNECPDINSGVYSNGFWLRKTENRLLFPGIYYGFSGERDDVRKTLFYSFPGEK